MGCWGFGCMLLVFREDREVWWERGEIRPEHEGYFRCVATC